MILKVNLNDYKKKLFNLILFLIVFNPPILKRVSFTTIFIILGGGYLLVNLQNLCNIIKKIKKPLVLFLLFIIYYLVICLFNSSIASIDYRIIWSSFFNSIFTLICSIMIALFIVVLSEKIGLSKIELMKSYVKIGFLQGVISVLCVISKGIKSTLNTLMINNSNSEKISNSLRNTSSFRNFGFASTLYDIFGFTMSILAIVAFYLGLKSKKKKYFLISIVIAISASLNARTSVILVVVGYLVFLISRQEKNTGNIFIRRSVFFVFFLIVAIVLFSTLLNSNSPRGEWFRTGIYEIKSLFQGENEGYFYTLFNEFIFFPEGILSIVLGTSLTPMEQSLMNTDVGYIQNIWKYGIIGSMLILSFWIMLTKESIKNCQKETKNKRLYIAILVMIFIYQIKLNCWGYSMAGCVFLPILFKSIEPEEETIYEINPM